MAPDDTHPYAEPLSTGVVATIPEPVERFLLTRLLAPDSNDRNQQRGYLDASCRRGDMPAHDGFT